MFAYLTFEQMRAITDVADAEDASCSFQAVVHPQFTFVYRSAHYNDVHVFLDFWSYILREWQYQSPSFSTLNLAGLDLWVVRELPAGCAIAIRFKVSLTPRSLVGTDFARPSHWFEAQHEANASMDVDGVEHPHFHQCATIFIG